MPPGYPGGRGNWSLAAVGSEGVFNDFNGGGRVAACQRGFCSYYIYGVHTTYYVARSPIRFFAFIQGPCFLDRFFSRFWLLLFSLLFAFSYPNIDRSIIYLSLQVSNIVPHHICYITPNTASRHRLPPGTTKV